MVLSVKRVREHLDAMAILKRKLRTVGLSPVERTAYARALGLQHALDDVARWENTLQKTVVDSGPLTAHQVDAVEPKLIASCTENPDGKVVAVFSDGDEDTAKAVVICTASREAWYVRFWIRDGMFDIVSVEPLEGAVVTG